MSDICCTLKLEEMDCGCVITEDIKSQAQILRECMDFIGGIPDNRIRREIEECISEIIGE